MIEQLLGSKTRVKLLQLFLSNPNRSFYVREITRKVDEQINSVRRELSNLLNIGIIISDTTNNRLYYEVNQSYEFYEPLRMIFGGAGVHGTKTAAKATKQDEELKALGNIELLLYTGQFTRDERAGVDVLIVGHTNANAVQKFVAELEKKENKQLRYTVMTPDDFQYRRQIRDRFIGDVLTAKKQVVIDMHGVLEEEET
ncbi:MAG TPA: transcriptional regulator [Candidatus Saccharimonadales bacterium]|nr:transcriptional regulator [Candidatus Saccharimonadales bacterium]